MKVSNGRTKVSKAPDAETAFLDAVTDPNKKIRNTADSRKSYTRGYNMLNSACGEPSINPESAGDFDWLYE